MSRTNVCWYWCFEQNSKKDASCYEQNRCRTFLFYSCVTICMMIGVAGLLILLAMLCGFLRDQILNQTNCHIENGVFLFEKCIHAGLDTLGWYILNLFYTAMCIWPLGVFIYLFIKSINTARIAALLSLLSILLGLIFAVFFNMLLAWLWIVISHKKVYEDDKYGCVLGNVSKSLNIGCTNDGMFPLGLSIFLFNLLIVGIFIGIAKMIECYSATRKAMKFEQQKTLPDVLIECDSSMNEVSPEN